MVSISSGKKTLFFFFNLAKYISFFSDLNEETSIAKIKERIHEITEIPLHLIEIRFGFPPKALNTSDESTLKDGGIKSGGKMITYSSNNRFKALISYGHYND